MCVLNGVSRIAALHATVCEASERLGPEGGLSRAVPLFLLLRLLFPSRLLGWGSSSATSIPEQALW